MSNPHDHTENPSPHPKPLTAPHFPAIDHADPLDPGQLRKSPPVVQEALLAYRDLVRIARDLSSEPALPHILAVLRAAEPGLWKESNLARDRWSRATIYRERVAGLSMDSLENIRAADDAEGRLMQTEEAWNRADDEWAEVDRVVRRHGG